MYDNQGKPYIKNHNALNSQATTSLKEVLLHNNRITSDLKENYAVNKCKAELLSEKLARLVIF